MKNIGKMIKEPIRTVSKKQHSLPTLVLVPATVMLAWATTWGWLDITGATIDVIS